MIPFLHPHQVTETEFFCLDFKTENCNFSIHADKNCPSISGALKPNGKKCADIPLFSKDVNIHWTKFKYLAGTENPETGPENFPVSTENSLIAYHSTLLSVFISLILSLPRHIHFANCNKCIPSVCLK